MTKQERISVMKEISHLTNVICDEYVSCDDCPLHVLQNTTVSIQDGARYYIGGCIAVGIERVFCLHENIELI